MNVTGAMLLLWCAFAVALIARPTGTCETAVHRTAPTQTPVVSVDGRMRDPCRLWCGEWEFEGFFFFLQISERFSKIIFSQRIHHFPIVPAASQFALVCFSVKYYSQNYYTLRVTCFNFLYQYCFDIGFIPKIQSVAIQRLPEPTQIATTALAAALCLFSNYVLKIPKTRLEPQRNWDLIVI